MHLADVTMFHTPHGGGVGRYLRAKRSWLRRHTAVRHTLIVPGARDEDYGDGDIELAAPRIPHSGGYRFPLGIERWTRRIMAVAPDLIECADPYAPAHAVLRAADALSVPAIAFCHSDLVQVAQTRLGSVGRALATHYLRGLYNRFATVIAPSRHIAARLDALGVRNVVTRPLGVDTEVFHPAGRSELLRHRLGLGPAQRLLVFAGRFAREKNLPVLVQALQRLGPRYHLVLIGSGSLPPLPRNVSSLGYVGDVRRLASLLASCDALVHAGDQETCGLVALEAMACGLPVACVAGGAVSELVTETTGVAATTARPVALAEAVDAVFARGAATLGAAAREHAVRHHGWDAVMRSLVRTYSTIAATALRVSPPLYATR
jgi:alpha-1,6-mannosyltransferase